MCFLWQCGLSGVSDLELQEVKKTFLTGQNVEAVGPVLVSSEQKYSRVAAMRTLAADGRQYHVLFLLTGKMFMNYLFSLKGTPLNLDPGLSDLQRPGSSTRWFSWTRVPM